MNKINQKNHIEDIVMEIDDAQVRTIQIIHTMVKQIDQLEKRFKESSKNKKELADIVEIKFVGIEFDYDKVKQGEKEANNAEKFKELHKENKNIAVPIVYREATSRRVLTMEWIDGVKLTNLDAVKKLGINPDEMIEIGVNCSLQQLIVILIYRYTVNFMSVYYGKII